MKASKRTVSRRRAAGKPKPDDAVADVCPASCMDSPLALRCVAAFIAAALKVARFKSLMVVGVDGTIAWTSTHAGPASPGGAASAIEPALYWRHFGQIAAWITRIEVEFANGEVQRVDYRGVAIAQPGIDAVADTLTRGHCEGAA